MTAQHTPGPWHIGGRTVLRPTLTIYHKPFGLGDVAEVYEDANARLIAAAPETAAERDELLRVLQFVAADPCFRVLGSVTQEEVHAAIAKVTGQEGGAA
jgi:hypothetical protein